MEELEDSTLWSDMSTRDSPPRTGAEVPRRPETPPTAVPADIIEYQQESEWKGNVNIRQIRRTVPGTHVWCVYVLKFIHVDSPLPQIDGRKAVPKLTLLERGGRHRPRVSDYTPGGYIRRLGVATQDLDNVVVPSHPGKYVYTQGNGSWILYDFVREPLCATCKAPLLSLNGRTARTIDVFSFRPCCYPAPTFHKLRPSANTDIAEVIPMFYDLETTPNDDGVHQFYLGVTTIPDAYLAAGVFNDKYQRVNSADHFMDIIDKVLRFYSEDGNERKRSLQLVSFNGSRYDELFLVTAWREYVYKRWGRHTLDTVEYSERKGALTFNTLQVSRLLEVRWTDLARFVPPTSLKNLAKSFKLQEEKGSMPFEALNDFVQRGPDSVARDEDGFLSLELYYKNNTDERAQSHDYYKQCVPEAQRTHDVDIDIFCLEYCKQDVRVTELAYITLQRLYSTYLADQADASPFNADQSVFNPMCLHSLATMAGKIMMASAVGRPSWGFNSSTKEERTGLWDLHSPRGAVYDFIRLGLVGGWVKGYFQGLLVSDDCPAEIRDLTTALQYKHESLLVSQVPGLEMTDIASMYPVAVTYAMPLGTGEWVEDAARRAEIIQETIDCDDPLRIHKFFVRCKWKAPTAPLFSESTLPQRKDKTNAVRWTYWNDPSGERVVTSLDLWIACRDHLGTGPSSTWTCYDSTEMLFFPVSAQVYRPFMEACAKLKTDGAKSNNEEQRTIGKIAMNSAIGKLGQSVEAKLNVLGEAAAWAVAQERGDNVRLVGTAPVDITGGPSRPDIHDTEYIFGVKDVSKNMWPIHHAAFMYAATRLMRLNWSIMTRPKDCGTLLEQQLPDTLYGDTDSKLLLKAHAELMPTEALGSTVGVFQPEFPTSVLTRPFFQVEPEKVSLPPMISIIAGIITSKKYFVLGFDPTTNKSILKFKCNGLTKFISDKHPCPLHSIVHCTICKTCSHGEKFIFSCVVCSFSLLKTEEISYERAPTSRVSHPCAYNLGTIPYKYDTYELASLTVLDFLRVLISGQPCKTVSDTFVRTLSLPTSKLPAFSVQTASQSRSLSCPALLRTTAEVALDRPSDKKLSSFVSGCAQLDSSSGVLKPSGNYLLQCLH